MSSISEGARNILGATVDSVGASGVKSGWDQIRKENHHLYSVPVAVGGGALLGVETFMFPNSARDFVIEDNVSTYSEYLKSGREIVASMVLDGLSFAGAVGVGVLTNSLEAAVVAKVALNAATSVATRTRDSIQRRTRVTA